MKKILLAFAVMAAAVGAQAGVRSFNVNNIGEGYDGWSVYILGYRWDTVDPASSQWLYVMSMRSANMSMFLPDFALGTGEVSGGNVTVWDKFGSADIEADNYTEFLIIRDLVEGNMSSQDNYTVIAVPNDLAEGTSLVVDFKDLNVIEEANSNGPRSGGSAVPEPTSGLLLLLGMAGLALKRKAA